MVSTKEPLFSSRLKLLQKSKSFGFTRAYLQTGLIALFCPWLDWRPPIRLSARVSPALLARPSPTLPSLLVVRPGTEAGLVSVGFEADPGRCFAPKRTLLRRLVEELEGRDARRAAGLSSPAGLVASCPAVGTRRLDPGVVALVC